MCTGRKLTLLIFHFGDSCCCCSKQKNTQRSWLLDGLLHIQSALIMGGLVGMEDRHVPFAAFSIQNLNEVQSILDPALVRTVMEGRNP